MYELSIVASIIGVFGTISSIFFAYLAFRKNERLEAKNEGKEQGSFLSDICYIKSCVDRMEKNFITVDERYKNILERLSKVEEVVIQITKRVDKAY